MARFINRQTENLGLAWALLTDYAPRIVVSAAKLNNFASYYGDWRGNIRAAAAYWLGQAPDIFEYEARTCRLRDSINGYMADGDSAWQDPFGYNLQKHWKSPS